jgi:processive 1,2-diacylglycerol beta-glucosyltransferase
VKILILTAATGGGHKRAAHAIESYITELSAGNQVVVLDALQKVGPMLNHTCCDGYRLLCKHAPKAFGRLYRKTNKESTMQGMMFRINYQHSGRLAHAIYDVQPDVILSTHPFATEMVSRMKAKGYRVPLICLMTDYGPHQAWIAPHVDAYVVSNEDMVPQMEEMGVPPEIVFPYGIPVTGVFFQKSDKAALRKGFDLAPEKTTILFMAGSFGVTGIIGIYEDLCQLDMDFQVIVITGRNMRLYNEFEKIVPESSKTTRLIYFTDKVADYMHASDLLITKPGGLTVSEALASDLPLAVFDAIPGQEEDNAAFLQNHHMAVKLDKHEDAAQVIAKLLEDPQKLTDMRHACETFDKSKAAQNIFMLMQHLYDRYHTQPAE